MITESRPQLPLISFLTLHIPQILQATPLGKSEKEGKRRHSQKKDVKNSVNHEHGRDRVRTLSAAFSLMVGHSDETRALTLRTLASFTKIYVLSLGQRQTTDNFETMGIISYQPYFAFQR